MIKALYIAADGEIKLFEAESRYVVEESISPLVGQGEYERQYERIEPVTVRLEKGIRQLLEEIDRLRTELEEAGAELDYHLG